MARNMPKERKLDMYEAILELKDIDECVDFFDDLCAMTELSAMEQRFEVAKMLKEDKVYTEIMQQTSASSATISRVHRMMATGTGCMEKILDRMAEKEES